MSDHAAAPRSRAEAEKELEQVSAKLRHVDTAIYGSFRWPSATAGAMLAIVAAIFVLVALYAAFWYEGDEVPSPAVLLVIAAVLAVPSFVLLRRGYEPYWKAARYRRELVERVRVLQDVLAGLAVNDQGRTVELDGPPVPLHRRPTPFAQTVWNRLPLGPSPADMLARLPEGTPKARLAFHRYLGWGFVAWLILALVAAGFIVQRLS